MSKLITKMPKEIESKLKDAIKGSGKFVGLRTARDTTGGNSRFIVFLQKDDGVHYGLFTEADGYFFESKRGYSSLDRAESEAECRGYFEHADDDTSFGYESKFKMSEPNKDAQPGNEKMIFTESVCESIYKSTRG